MIGRKNTALKRSEMDYQPAREDRGPRTWKASTETVCQASLSFAAEDVTMIGRKKTKGRSLVGSPNGQLRRYSSPGSLAM